jgi:hypothetical protein
MSISERIHERGRIEAIVTSHKAKGRETLAAHDARVSGGRS